MRELLPEEWILLLTAGALLFWATALIVLVKDSKHATRIALYKEAEEAGRQRAEAMETWKGEF